jgi:small GTP-binding protein
MSIILRVVSRFITAKEKNLPLRQNIAAYHRTMASPSQKKPVVLTHTVKLVLLGDSGVGKTSLAHRFVKNDFHPFQEATIGATYLSRPLILPEEDGAVASASTSRRAVELKIWDTAGQERYQSLTPLYFRGAGGALLVYDVTKIHSYQTLQRWVRELKHIGPENVLLTVCGNKADLHQERTVSEADARAYAESIGAVYMEVSAKTGENVTAVFESIAVRVSQEERFIRPPDVPMNDSLDLSARRRLTTSCCY